MPWCSASSSPALDRDWHQRYRPTTALGGLREPPEPGGRGGYRGPMTRRGGEPCEPNDERRVAVAAARRPAGIEHWEAWPVAAFAATAVYILGASVELAPLTRRRDRLSTQLDPPTRVLSSRRGQRPSPGHPRTLRRHSARRPRARSNRRPSGRRRRSHRDSGRRT